MVRTAINQTKTEHVHDMLDVWLPFLLKMNKKKTKFLKPNWNEVSYGQNIV